MERGKPLSLMGGKIFGREKGNKAPISIDGNKLKGCVIGTPVASAQVKSAILLAGLKASEQLLSLSQHLQETYRKNVKSIWGRYKYPRRIRQEYSNKARWGINWCGEY